MANVRINHQHSLAHLTHLIHSSFTYSFIHANHEITRARCTFTCTEQSNFSLLSIVFHHFLALKLSCAEALAATLLLTGFEQEAVVLLGRFKWGLSFLNVNAELLQLYCKCESSSAIVEVQTQWMHRLAAEQQKHAASRLGTLSHAQEVQKSNANPSNNNNNNQSDADAEEQCCSGSEDSLDADPLLHRNSNHVQIGGKRTWKTERAEEDSSEAEESDSDECSSEAEAESDSADQLGSSIKQVSIAANPIES